VHSDSDAISMPDLGALDNDAREPTLAYHRRVSEFEPGYPRDLVGYGRNAPHPRWPAEARIAVQFVLNYEEGAENNVLHGDAASETFLSEIVGAVPFAGKRHMNMESLYEYGSRAGLWRLLREFERRGLPLTVFAVAMALARHPEAAAAFVSGGHEIASHGWRWIDYRDVPESEEREHIALAVETLRKLTGNAPLGWYTGWWPSTAASSTTRIPMPTTFLIGCASPGATN
jgi:allantoinase